MNPITQGLSQGYDSEEILDFLMKAIPAVSSRVKKAKRSGHSSESILDFLSKTMDGGDYPSTMTQSQIHGANAKRQELLTKQLLKTTGTAVGGGLLAQKALQYAPKISQGISGILGRGKPQAVSPSQVAKAPIEEAFGQTPPLPPIASGTPPPVPNSPEVNQLIDKLGLGSKIKRVAERTAPEAITGALRNMITPDMEKIIQEKAGKPMGEAIKDYAESFLSEREKGNLSLDSLRKQAEKLKFPQEEMNGQDVGAKAHKMVVMPNGEVGHLVGERQGIGTVQMPDGKTRTQKMEDLEVGSEDFERKITDLIEAIPEDERSSVLAFASYNPGQELLVDGKKESYPPMMGVQFHNGDFYLYPGISKDRFDKVVTKAVKAKTTGENPWHAWTSGKESRGAGMAELIKELEAEFGKNFIKFKANEGYDYFKRVRKKISEIQRRKKTQR